LLTTFLNKPLSTVIKVGLILALIGPTLSFFSLILQLNYPSYKALFYALTTYVLDIAVTFIFGVYLSRTSSLSLYKSLKISFVANYPVWICDIFDIYQPLRILSNIGILFGIAFLFKKLSDYKDGKYAIFSIIIYILLYILDSIVSELIATNPILKTLLQEI